MMVSYSPGSPVFSRRSSPPVEECPERRGVHRVLDVGVGQHDHRVVAAQLQQHPLQVAAGRFGEPTAGGRGGLAQQPGDEAHLEHPEAEGAAGLPGKQADALPAAALQDVGHREGPLALRRATRSCVQERASSVHAKRSRGRTASRYWAGRQRAPEVLTPNLWEEVTPENLALWQRELRGPMASFGAEAGGFTRSGSDRPAPDLQFGAIPGPPPLPELGPPTERAVGTLVGAVRVRSRGRVTLASADPAAKPIVDPAYFADEADLDVLVAGVRMAREIAACEPLAGITAGEVMPGEGVDDDEQIRDWVRATVGSMFHPTGTCAMGGAAGAVCDPELRVRGVEGLRVVDASVMPVTPRGNTNAPTIAVAERAADLIQGDTPLSTAALERELA
jgi:hypothetical protein